MSAGGLGLKRDFLLVTNWVSRLIYLLKGHQPLKSIASGQCLKTDDTLYSLEIPILTALVAAGLLF